MSVRVEGLVAGYGATEVLRGVDLDVGAGSLACVLGPSGCGKTTLLRVLAGFEPARAGTVRIGGRVVDDPVRRVAPERRRVGYVPQEGALFPHQSVAGNVGFALGAGRAGRPGRSARVAELLGLVGLGGLGGRRPHQLSGGQQQRVALARALAGGPELVLLDEPFAALDPALRSRLREDIRAALAATAVTAVLVTHDRAEALSLADQVAVVRDGRVVQAGPPADVYARPADAGVAVFVGDANLLAAGVNGGHVVTALGVAALDSRCPTRGGPGVAVVAPEAVRLGAPGPAGAPSGGGGCGRVVRLEYFGHDARVVVELPPAATGPSGAAPLRVVARVAGAALPAAGAAVAVTVAGPLWVLPPDASGAPDGSG